MGETTNAHQEATEPANGLDASLRAFMAGAWGDLPVVRAYIGGDVSETTLRRDLRRGALKAYRIGGRKLLRFKRADVDQYITEQAARVLPYEPRRRRA